MPGLQIRGSGAAVIHFQRRWMYGVRVKPIYVSAVARPVGRPAIPIPRSSESNPESRLPEGFSAVASDQTCANCAAIDPGKEPTGQQHIRYGQSAASQQNR